MDAKLPPIDDNADAELTKLVYTLVMEPERLHLMLQLLDRSVSPILERDEDMEATTLFDDLQIHFENAFEMLERRKDNQPSRSIARKLVDADTGPSILLNSDGVVLRANNAAVRHLGASEGSALDISTVHSADKVALQRALKNIQNETQDRLIDLFSFSSSSESAPVRMIMSKVVDTDGKPIAHLTGLKTNWQPDAGDSFSNAFKLTIEEKAIVRALVEGAPLSRVTELTGTPVLAVHDQLDAMLAKLGLNSQTELICMYVGFSQISISTATSIESNPPLAREDNEFKIFKRQNGSPLEVEFYGPAAGTPVLFFHPFMGGTLLSEAQKSVIHARKLRFVMPLQPGMKGTLDPGTRGDRLGDYARDLANILEQLGIEKCPALCVNMSLIYALAFEAHVPGVLTQIVTSNAPVPLRSSQQIKQVSIPQRVPYLIARYVPSLLKFYVRSVQAKLESGGDLDFMTNYYSDSPLDLETIVKPEIRDLFRLSALRIFKNGHEAPLQHMRMQILDWTSYLEKTSLPITLLNGAGDTEFSHANVKQSVQNFNNVHCVEVPNAGALLWYQNPEAVLSHLRT
ncbi:MAG: hypothetical protein ACRBEQ_12705 [Hyphomonas sp.]